MRESNPLQLTGQGSGPLEVRWLSPEEPPRGCRPARKRVSGAPWRPRRGSPLALAWPSRVPRESLRAISGSGLGELPPTTFYSQAPLRTVDHLEPLWTLEGLSSR
jgi:hypothetical protein